MENYTVFPDQSITDTGPIGRIFKGLDIGTFHEACRWVHQLPYGYNSDRDDLMILFKEKMGSCTTKHAVIATLAAGIAAGMTFPDAARMANIAAVSLFWRDFFCR